MTCGTPHSRIPLICVKTDKATSPAIFSCPTFCSQPIRTLHLNCRKTPMPDRSLLWIRCILYTYHLLFRATSHTRPRARDHHTSSALIGGKGGVGPSLLPSHHAWGTIEVISECKMDVKSTWIRTWHRMDHVSGAPNTCQNLNVLSPAAYATVYSMVTCIVSKNHLWEVGLTQDWETNGTWYFYHV